MRIQTHTSTLRNSVILQKRDAVKKGGEDEREAGDNEMQVSFL